MSQADAPTKNPGKAHFQETLENILTKKKNAQKGSCNIRIQNLWVPGGFQYIQVPPCQTRKAIFFYIKLFKESTSIRSFDSLATN